MSEECKITRPLVNTPLSHKRSRSHGEEELSMEASKFLKLAYDNTEEEFSVFETRQGMVVAIKGVELSDFTDLCDGVCMQLNPDQLNDRVRNVVLAIISKVWANNKKIKYVCGHSMGGSVARLVARKLDVKGLVFNEGSRLCEFSWLWSHDERKGFVVGYLSKTDPLSLISRLHRHSIYDQFKLYNHGLFSHTITAFKTEN